MKKLLYFILLTWMGVGMMSCGSTKGVAYLQDDGSGGKFDQAFAKEILYDARIMPKDLLTIVVNATEPEAVRPFNLLMPSFQAPSASETSSLSLSAGGGQGQLQAYLVDNEGYVNFPVIGLIQLKGLTKGQAEEKIKGMLKEYIKETPIVTVKFVNYKISVLGEVKSPSTFTIANEKVNIFEALAMAGDMTIYGLRDNVKIIREDAEGKKSIIYMNLNDRNIIHSDNFYLQQNDVVYIQPNKIMAQNSGIGASTSLWFSAVGILFSATTLAMSIISFNR